MAYPTYPEFSEQAQTDLQDLLGMLEEKSQKLRSGEQEILAARRGGGEELGAEELRMLMEAGLRVGVFSRKQVSMEIAATLGLARA